MVCSYRGAAQCTPCSNHPPGYPECHPVSNDVVRCQADSGDTRAATRNRAPFRSRGKVLTLPTKARALKSGSGRKVSLSISSVLAPMIPVSNSPPHAGRPAAHSSDRSNLRPQNDSGSPAPRPYTVARRSSLRATSGTTSPPACAPPLLSPDHGACALPADDRSALTRHRSGLHSVRLPVLREPRPTKLGPLTLLGPPLHAWRPTH